MEKYCDGKIDCPWLTPNDEANCTECSTRHYNSSVKRCECNQKENFTCEFEPSNATKNRTCYSSKGK